MGREVGPRGEGGREMTKRKQTCNKKGKRERERERERDQKCSFIFPKELSLQGNKLFRTELSWHKNRELREVRFHLIRQRAKFEKISM